LADSHLALARFTLTCAHRGLDAPLASGQQLFEFPPTISRKSDTANLRLQSRTNGFSGVIHNFLTGAGFCIAIRMLF
jgi:hypothetical protein